MIGWIEEKWALYAVIRAEDQRRYYLFEAAFKGDWKALQTADAVEFTTGLSRSDKVVECVVTGRAFEPGTEGWA